MNLPIITATCDGCLPWVRFWPGVANAPIRQELHEDHCHVFPRMQRIDN